MYSRLKCSDDDDDKEEEDKEWEEDFLLILSRNVSTYPFVNSCMLINPYLIFLNASNSI